MTTMDRPGHALAQKTVLVVGGTSGMGRGISQAAAMQGARVIAFGSRPLDSGINHEHGGSIRHASLDMTEDAAVAAAFAGVGRIDHVLVTATPAGSGEKLMERSIEQARRW
jgi:NAD(P)-dependent dehydrogenase (short-subunit alcohol dehydrogenase family)